jgi:hypothetical protein
MAAVSSNGSQVNGKHTKDEILRDRSCKPHMLPVNAEDVPHVLKEQKVWICWCWRWVDNRQGAGKWSKIPIVPACGHNAKTDCPESWRSFLEALAYYQTGQVDGIGFVFAKGAGFTGIDLDKCRDTATGRLSDWATAIVADLDTYCEVSPTGTGVKLIALGTKPPGRSQSLPNDPREIEMYSHGRFFCITGHRMGSEAEVMARQDEINRLQASLERKPTERKPHNQGPANRELALSAVKSLAAARAVPYQSWLSVGMALHSVSGDDKMLAAWKEFSKLCPEKFSDAECERKWRSFKGAGVTIGTLIKWALEDGWQRPKSGNQHHENTSPGISMPVPDGLTGYDLILDHFRKKYDPTFRRGTCLFSRALGRDVRQGEALAGAGKELIDCLATASDAPRYEMVAKRSALPQFFKTWAPSAWVDLLDSLPDEETTDEICDPARDEFRGKVSAALCTLVALAYRREGRDDVERRSLIDWARMFAKAGRWQKIRGYLLWSRLDTSDHGLRIALRVELFTQSPGGNELARLGQRKFADRARLYGVGMSVKVSGGDSRAIELAPEFLNELLAEPVSDADGQKDAETRVRAREDSASV